MAMHINYFCTAVLWFTRLSSLITAQGRERLRHKFSFDITHSYDSRGLAIACSIYYTTLYVYNGHLPAGVDFINILRLHFSYKILAPKITKLNVTREKLLNLLSYEKCSNKMLMKLTPGVNFINILNAASMFKDPKSAKKTDSLIVFFALLGSECIKTVFKMLVKLPLDQKLN